MRMNNSAFQELKWNLAQAKIMFRKRKFEKAYVFGGVAQEILEKEKHLKDYTQHLMDDIAEWTKAAKAMDPDEFIGWFNKRDHTHEIELDYLEGTVAQSKDNDEEDDAGGHCSDGFCGC